MYEFEKQMEEFKNAKTIDDYTALEKIIYKGKDDIVKIFYKNAGFPKFIRKSKVVFNRFNGFYYIYLENGNNRLKITFEKDYCLINY